VTRRSLGAPRHSPSQAPEVARLSTPQNVRRRAHEHRLPDHERRSIAKAPMGASQACGGRWSWFVGRRTRPARRRRSPVPRGRLGRFRGARASRGLSSASHRRLPGGHAGSWAWIDEPATCPFSLAPPTSRPWPPAGGAECQSLACDASASLQENSRAPLLAVSAWAHPPG
jgi:hypothetical protein